MEPLRNTRPAILTLYLLAVCEVLQGAFDPHSWAARRFIKPVGPGLNYVVVDSSMYEDSKASLRDIRLLQGGEEVPFVIRTLYGTADVEQITTSLTDEMLVPTAGLQFVLQAKSGGPHNQVSIQTHRTNFRQRVSIETSDDKHYWGMVRNDGVFYDVTSVDGHSAGLTVSYPSSTRPYVRVTIHGWTHVNWLQSASISYLQTIPAQRDLIAVLTPAISENEQQHHTSELKMDLGFERPYDRISLDVGPGWFSRRAAVLTSPDANNWLPAGGTVLLRSAAQENLVAEIPEHWERYIRLQISNEDNRPLQIRQVQIKGLQRRLLFDWSRVANKGLLFLYSGNAQAEEARYDLGSVLPANTDANEAKLGEAGVNPAYQPAKIPSALPSWMLTGVLFLLVPAVGLIAFRMLRQVRSV